VKFWKDIVRQGGKKIPIAIVIPLQFAVKFFPMLAEVAVQKQKNGKGWAQVALSNIMYLLSLTIILISLAGPGATQEPPEENSPAQTSKWKIDRWYIYTSLYTRHFDPQPEHVNKQKMLGVEAQMMNNWLFGFASFDNSFGQRSEYLYAGYKWALFHSRYWYFKLTGGLLYGYKEPYEDKIPLNGLGIAPAILPTLGFRYKFFATEVNLAGNAAVNVTAGISF
jgi:hypothetical protein